MASRYHQKLYPQLILLGDSLFQRCNDIQEGFSFQAALQEHCMRRYDVVNRGMSGYNTSQTLNYLPTMFTPPGPGIAKIEYLVILLGANDAALPISTGGNQAVTLESYKENLKNIITHPIFTAHGAKVLLVTPPPLDEIKLTVLDLAQGKPAVSRTSKRSAKYSQVCRDLASEIDGVVLVDLWRSIMDKAIEMCPEWKKKGITDGPPFLGDPECGLEGGLDTLLPDGLHMSGDAYRVLADQLLRHIKPEWADPSQDDKTEYVFPDWQEATWLEKDRN